MLTGSNIVAFVATTNGGKARLFYQEVLGLDFISDDEFATVLSANGVELRIQKVQSLTPHQHTQLGTSIDRVVRALRAKGMEFESYPFLQQDELGIWTTASGAKVAWFRDPDGNLLSLTEPPTADLT
jgi:catechol 2,3-dioxygenase-like lactoylglutathione lyase family enzyme